MNLRCPVCKTEMDANRSLTDDRKQLLTTWLCPNCCKRVLVRAPNPIMPIETKLRTPIISGNPHKKRWNYPAVSTADIPISNEGNGQ